jgi:hypothetical protein
MFEEKDQVLKMHIWGIAGHMYNGQTLWGKNVNNFRRQKVSESI